LQKLAHQTFGPVLLGIVAAGLVVYGLFYLVRAVYREV
jgi:high-affinity Fe2+/Pb2+ permease